MPPLRAKSVQAAALLGYVRLDVQHFWLKAVDLVYITSASPEGA